MLADFGYDPRADENARDLAAALLARAPRPDTHALRRAIESHDVAILGPRPSKTPDAPLLATDGAASWLDAPPLAIVTDLDGDIERQIAWNATGVPLYLHAHGDNRDTLRQHAPRLRGPVQPTTQARPVPGVENHGGFTDGDRACCLAAELGARSLTLVGFDFEEPWPKTGRDPATKRRKLAWARRIVDGLGVPWRLA